jgi:2-dehydropantoate 2-reductase
MPSLHIDLHSGKGRSEVDWLNGAVERAGQTVGVNTPVNQFLNETLLGLVANREKQNPFHHNPAGFMAAGKS